MGAAFSNGTSSQSLTDSLFFFKFFEFFLDSARKIEIKNNYNDKDEGHGKIEIFNIFSLILFVKMLIFTTTHTTTLTLYIVTSSNSFIVH